MGKRSLFLFLFLLLGAGVAVVVALTTLSSDDVPPVAPSLQPSRPPLPPPREDFEAPPEAPPAPVAEPAPLPPPPPPPVVLAPIPRPGKSLPIDPEALAGETALLDRAQREAKTDPELALRSLTEHEQLFPVATLRVEAQLIKLEALLRLGRREEADELAGKITRGEPGLTKPVQKLLERVRPR